MSFTYKQLQPTDVSLYQALMKLFGEVFEENESYQKAPPDTQYIQNFLTDNSHVMLVAMDEGGTVVGGLVAYFLHKFEQARTELYVYDLAVSPSHQRKGIATGLFSELKNIARKRGAYIIFVQADKEDEGAVAFYRTLSMSEEACYNFDIVL